MFRSIRWRLVASYVFLTLLTVTVLGALASSLIRQNIRQQEAIFLASNADVIADQAMQFLLPVVRESDLQLLADTASILANIRVRIYDAQHEILVDTGPNNGVDQFLWIQPGEEFGFETTSEFPGGFITPILFTIESRNQFQGYILSQFMETFPSETRFTFIHRIPQPWGDRMFFEEPTEIIAAISKYSSSQVLAVPIGDLNQPFGFVELSEGPVFGMETMKTTTRAFLLAAAGSLLLAGIVGILVARRLTSPIVQLSNIADQRSAGDLSVRSPKLGKDEIGQLAQRFNQMAARLEESFKTLSSERDTLRRFISDASHELRNPITAMKNFIELLQGKAIKDTQARDEFLLTSQEQLYRMEWITQNLLDLSRLEAGLLALKLEQKDIKDVLVSITSTFKTRTDKKDIQFLIGEPDPSFDIVADQSLLEIALLNLLDNALKFTSKGGKIKLTAGEEGDHIRFTVQDTGTGIDSEDLPHIFKRFYRGKSVTAEGSGLGLAMVDSVVKAHGGEVSVESEPGIGSTFSIELPKSIEAATAKRLESNQE